MVQYQYYYDNLGQLLREDNTAKNRTYVYTYDNAGNILTKKTYDLTAAGVTPSTLYSTNTYGYNDESWGDLLTSFNGQTITYDSIGNPLSYYNGSSSYSFTWENGRQLASASGPYTLSFEYNDEGIRTEKVVDGVVHTYYLSGSQIEAETWGDKLCIYIYDAEGSPIGMQYRKSTMAEGVFYTFWFEKNLQGDIVAVYNESGVKVCTYTYDAWGNFTTTWNNGTGTNSYAINNPFTYRGYYYDSETGFYSLQSRYYDPEIGRFINADSEISGTGKSMQGYNLFEYCNYNPVNKSDSTGAWPKWIKNASSAITKAAKKVAGVVTNTVNSIKSSFSPANHVKKTHVTTPTAMLNLGTLFGKVGLSSTVTKQNKEPGLVHSASDIGNDASKYSVGINIVGWLGADVGVSSEINAFVSAQVTPWVHVEVSAGLDGIGAVIGFDVGDTSFDFELKGGWCLIAIFVAPQLIATGGQPSRSPA